MRRIRRMLLAGLSCGHMENEDGSNPKISPATSAATTGNKNGIRILRLRDKVELHVSMNQIMFVS